MKKLLVCVFILLSGVVALHAQDLTETFTFENGVMFDYPAGGRVDVDAESPNLVMVETEEGDQVLIVNSPLLVANPVLDDDPELFDIIDWLIEFFWEDEPQVVADELESVSLPSGSEALIFMTEEDDEEVEMVLVVQFAGDMFGAIYDAGDAEEIKTRALAIADTFRLETTGPEKEAPVSSSGATCTISTTEANSVQLRVGAGTNRGVFAFLPAFVDFTPEGRIETDDGSVWFKLNKDKAAPNAAANEAWVAAEDVDTDGDCDNIGESSNSPVIPGAPPPASDNSNQGNDNSSSQSSGGPVEAIPGTWTINYASTGKASCLDIEGTVDFNPGWSPDVVTLSVSGSTVIMSGNRFTQIQPNVFSGTFTLSNGSSLQFILHPVSPTQFSGDAMLTGVVDGHTCSNTVPLTITRN